MRRRPFGEPKLARIMEYDERVRAVFDGLRRSAAVQMAFMPVALHFSSILKACSAELRSSVGPDEIQALARSAIVSAGESDIRRFFLHELDAVRSEASASFSPSFDGMHPGAVSLCGGKPLPGEDRAALDEMLDLARKSARRYDLMRSDSRSDPFSVVEAEADYYRVMSSFARRLSGLGKKGFDVSEFNQAVQRDRLFEVYNTMRLPGHDGIARKVPVPAATVGRARGPEL